MDHFLAIVISKGVDDTVRAHSLDAADVVSRVVGNAASNVLIGQVGHVDDVASTELAYDAAHPGRQETHRTAAEGPHCAVVDYHLSPIGVADP